MELCLISCNIRFDNPADGQNSWPYRRELLVQTLLKHGPSLIATQEGRIQQLKELQDSLFNFELMDHHRSWIKERMYPSIYARTDSFEYLASGDMWLSETPEIAGSLSFESAFPRLMTWTRIQVKNSDVNLTIVNTHLDHVKQQTRVQQVRVLCEEINKIWDKQSALIIMGDFNDSPDSEVRKTITQDFPFLVDAWSEFNSQEESSHHAFNGETQNGSRIDWILIDRKLAIKNCLMDKSNHQGLYPTDHYPIICHISL